MRIISGFFKGKKIITPKNEKTRQAYGKQGEYEAEGMTGKAIPQFIN